MYLHLIYLKFIIFLLFLISGEVILSFFCCTSLSSIWTLFSISHITLACSFFAILASLSHFDWTRASICDSSSCSLFWTSLLICEISCYRISWKLPVCRSCTPAALYLCALAQTELAAAVCTALRSVPAPKGQEQETEMYFSTGCWQADCGGKKSQIAKLILSTPIQNQICGNEKMSICLWKNFDLWN